MYEYRAKLLRIVDADTLDLQVDLGFHISFGIRVRLAGLNAPERYTEEGKAATAFALEYLGDDDLVVETVKDRTEKYGRYLAYVSVVGNPVSLNAALLASGNAKPM